MDLTAPPTLLVTEREYAAHEQELARLRRQRDEELPRRLREARTYVASDAVEEIGHIQEEQAVVDSRIARLEELLQDATVIPDDQAGDMVLLGCTVEVEYESNGRRASWTLTGAGAAADPGYVTSRSPVGRALLGRASGESVTVELPNGRMERLKILSIEPPAARDGMGSVTP
jgi:transcription elongation factor GreA